ncbi:MAG: transcription antitermination factor NusB [Sphaerimonospora mesophila]
MASNRHLGRIIALQTLYEYDFRKSLGDDSADIDEVLERSLSHYGKKIGDRDFVETLARGVVTEAKQLDAVIAPVAPEWPLNQLPLADQEILRIALFELTHLGDQVPSKVVINEAVELGKLFGSENSSKFINGVLGTIWRQMDGRGE